MKYSPKIYARAFSETISGKLPAEKQTSLLKNFLKIINKNNDQHQLKKIYEQAEKMVREKIGRRKVVLETAREVKPEQEKLLNKFIKKDDLAEKKVNPDLIAGLRVIVDDEKQFDGSMARKIKELFS